MLTLSLTDIGLLATVDMLCASLASYLMLRYFAWRNDQIIKKKNPTTADGLNVDISYKQMNNEVMGLHLRGVDMPNVLENFMKGFGLWSKENEKQDSSSS